MKFIGIKEDYDNYIKQKLDEKEQIEFELLKSLFSFCIPRFENGCFRCDFHEVIKYMDNERKKQFILLLTKCFLLDGENNIYYSNKTIFVSVLADKQVKFLRQYGISQYAPYQEFHKSKNKIVYNANGKSFIICEF